MSHQQFHAHVSAYLEQHPTATVGQAITAVAQGQAS